MSYGWATVFTLAAWFAGLVIDELLSNPGRAAKIAAAGRKKALQKHTWKRRGEQIAKWMDDGLNFTY